MVSTFDLMREKSKEQALAKVSRKRRHAVKFMEDELNHACVRYFDLQYKKYWALLNHSPNEGKRSEREGANLKKKGMRPGFADLILMMPLLSYKFLAIELKTKQGRQSPTERFWQEQSEKNGGKYIVIRTFDDFKQTIDEWIKKAEIWQRIIDEITLYGAECTSRGVLQKLLEEIKE